MPRVKMPDNPETVWLANTEYGSFGPALVLKRTAKIVRVERSPFTGFREEVKTGDTTIVFCGDEREARNVVLGALASARDQLIAELAAVEEKVKRIAAGETPDAWGKFKPIVTMEG